MSTYEEGTVVTLIAKAGDGYVFDKWTGDASGTNTMVTITMDRNKNVQAVLDRDIYCITAAVLPNGDPECNTYYSKGKIKITDLKTGKVVSETNQNTWTHAVFDLDARVSIYSKYRAEYEIYFSQDGVNAVKSGTFHHIGLPIPLEAGGLVKLSMEISTDVPGYTYQHKIDARRIK